MHRRAFRISQWPKYTSRLWTDSKSKHVQKSPVQTNQLQTAHGPLDQPIGFDYMRLYHKFQEISRSIKKKKKHADTPREQPELI